MQSRKFHSKTFWHLNLKNATEFLPQRAQRDCLAKKQGITSRTRIEQQQQQQLAAILAQEQSNKEPK
ncbi:uncharacterized protein sano isoform X2 [Drosophila kikkawai]|uniref:Uncharacterized protein sano isoform X2 n=1 Tax=Drosophila kikkawai TaxID=30033 RepID=A0ABM4GBL0_DROKI